MNAMTINGCAVNGSARFDVINPATGSLFATAPDCTRDELDQAMSAAADAFPAWRADETFRIAKLHELSEAITAAAPRFAEILGSENGKPRTLGGLEATFAATWLDYYADLSAPQEILRDDDTAHVEVIHRPLGVVAAIAPWNMPVVLAFFKIAPALRAGNTMVLKPSPFTPISTLLIGEIARDILPPGVLNIVTGGDQLGQWMVEHPTPRKVSFTGSVATGKHVAATAGADLKRITLELGGNDPAILLDDVDIPAIAEGLFWTAFFNNGQACTLVKRVYAPERIYNDLVEALAAVARAVPVGDPCSENTALGPLSTKPQFDHVAQLVADARYRGAIIAAGGEPIDGPGFFFAPTVLAGLSDGCAIVDQEQFGPALPVVAYRDLDDAIQRANHGMFGLGASVWSADLDRGAEVAGHLDAGTVWVNTHAYLAAQSPFAGHKWSGLGVENGVWGLHSFTDIQVLHKNRGVPGPGAG